MKRIVITAFALAALLPLAAEAQQWTAEQNEIWAWETACWETQDLDVISACFHEDFVGWGDASLGVPTNHADRRATHERDFAARETLWVHVKPLSIKVYDNIAVVLYVATTTTKDKATGEISTASQRWTDIAMKTNGTWAWIADHGGPIEDDD